VDAIVLCVCRQVVIPVETLNMLAMAPSVPAASSAAQSLQLKSEGSPRGKPAEHSESRTTAAASSSGTGSGGAQQLAVQPQFIIPLQAGGRSPQPVVVETDEAPEPKRLRVADEEWASDS